MSKKITELGSLVTEIDDDLLIYISMIRDENLQLQIETYIMLYLCFSK